MRRGTERRRPIVIYVTEQNQVKLYLSDNKPVQNHFFLNIFRVHLQGYPFARSEDLIFI
jgi:hypothetical protein